MKTSSHGCTKWLWALAAIFFCTACSRYPANLQSRSDIWSTPADHYALSIGDLPLEYYPRLVKFVAVEQIDFKDGATDAKLSALARLPLPYLRTINMWGSKQVSDKGIVAIGEGKLDALEGLQLNATGVTDRSLAIMSAWPRFNGVSIIDCPGVTMAGIAVILQTPGLRTISFSTENLSPEQVVNIIRNIGVIEYCGVVDNELKLDEKLLRDIARERGVKILDIRRDAKYPGYKGR